MSQLVRYSIAWVQNSDFLDKVADIVKKATQVENKSVKTLFCPETK
jgi:hypothetical protein